MRKETEKDKRNIEAAGQNERVVITGVALLYQKQTKDGWENKVRCVLVNNDEGDDEYDLKAKAERYVANNEEMSEEVKDYNLVAWNTATYI